MIFPIVKGWYRYTDIWFEWPNAIEDLHDRSAIKAAFAHDSLVHPDHPFHVDGVDGVELHIGLLQNYENRLLFSSDQVEYIRYWLHAMKLTKALLPLPYSDCLLTDADLRGKPSRVIYKTGGDVRQAIKKIDKDNKRRKGANPMLHDRRQTFERARSCWSDKKGVWCAVDIEAWDRDHEVVTEFGWSAFKWEDGKEVEDYGHLIVKEYRHYVNTFVADNRERYSFGESEVIARANFKTRIQKLLESFQNQGPLFLVFHDYSQDIKYLQSKNVEADLKDLSLTLPDTTPNSGTFVVDTSEVFAALEGDSGHNKKSLERMCRHLQIPTEFLHNAGNDARYTALALKNMASGEPLDIQREQRWPNQTGNVSGPNAPQTGAGVQVKWQPWDEDSEYDDLEGMCGPANASHQAETAH